MTNLYWERRLFEPDSFDGETIDTKFPYNPGNLPAAGSEVKLSNSIKLDPNASGTDNYYVGYNVILTKVLPNGKTYTQTKEIVAYSGSTKIAIIDDVWDEGYEPAVTDSYKIVLAYPDKRVSINTVVQITDYITSKTYGRGLNPEKDLKLDTFTAAARKCDANSDVSLKAINNSGVPAGSLYRLTEGNRIIWEGEVRIASSNQYIMFTNVLGKITNKWNSWKVWEVGDIVYADNLFYKVMAQGNVATKPSHTSGQSGILQAITTLDIPKVSGNGPTSLSLDLNSNPVLMLNAEGNEISGYTLYDSDSIDYWRRLGWDEHSQSSATLYQTNFTIDTSAPLFDNINMMAEHCNAIFSYSQGRYTLDIESAVPEYVLVTEQDIIGKISFEDKGNSTAYNSVTVSFFDPGNNFETKNISLFSDSYLKQDRNVPKKGNITIVGTTNYYNVRLLADTYLKKSRNNATISLTLFPEFSVLQTGSVIGLNYSRFNWSNKPFRIDTLTLNPNGTITVIASEYSDSFYSLSNMNKTPSVGNRSGVVQTNIAAPYSLVATNTVNNNEIKDGILLSWTNAPMTDNAITEVYASDVLKSSLTITSISSNAVTFSEAHGLKIGSQIMAKSSGTGIISGRTYFVKSVLSPTSVTLSTQLNGDLLTLSDGINKNIVMDPYVFAGSVPYPQDTFLHKMADITETTQKFYRIRYKVQK